MKKILWIDDSAIYIESILRDLRTCINNSYELQALSQFNDMDTVIDKIDGDETLVIVDFNLQSSGAVFNGMDVCKLLDERSVDFILLTGRTDLKPSVFAELSSFKNCLSILSKDTPNKDWLVAQLALLIKTADKNQQRIKALERTESFSILVGMVMSLSGWTMKKAKQSVQSRIAKLSNKEGISQSEAIKGEIEKLKRNSSISRQAYHDYANTKN